MTSVWYCNQAFQGIRNLFAVKDGLDLTDEISFSDDPDHIFSHNKKESLSDLDKLEKHFGYEVQRPPNQIQKEEPPLVQAVADESESEWS